MLGLSADSVQLYGETSHSRIGNFSTQFGIIRSIVDDKETESISSRKRAPGHLSPDAIIYWPWNL